MPAVTLDGEPILNEQLNNVTSWTSSGTKTTAGNNRVVYLAIAGAIFNWPSTLTATYGGSPMTRLYQIRQATDSQLTAVFRYVAPHTAATGLTASFGGNGVLGRAIVWSVQDADQRNPERFVNFGKSGTGATSSLTVESAVNDLAICVMGSYNDNPTPNQTQIAEGSDSLGTRWGSVQRADGASSVAFSWTGVGSAGQWVVTGFSIRPALEQRVYVNRLRAAIFAPGIGN